MHNDDAVDESELNMGWPSGKGTALEHDGPAEGMVDESEEDHEGDPRWDDHADPTGARWDSGLAEDDGSMKQEVVKLTSKQLRSVIESLIKEAPADVPPSANPHVKEVLEELVAVVVDHYDSVYVLDDAAIDSLHVEVYNAVADIIDDFDVS